jgi:hypothetical protein
VDSRTLAEAKRRSGEVVYIDIFLLNFITFYNLLDFPKLLDFPETFRLSIIF